MSSFPPVQEGQFLNDKWQKVAPYVTPPMAASAAIVPVFYGFMVKSAQQLGDPLPKFNWNAVKAGFSASPTIGGIVGLQMIAGSLFEKAVIKLTNNPNPTSFTPMCISAMMVGLISAPALAVFNGQTIKDRTAMESLKLLSPKQVSAIVTRETSFLLAIRISGPVSEKVKHVAGDSKMAKYLTIFMTGVIGSVVGHPADTALTLWQKNRQITSFRQLMNGSPAKAIAVGGFSIAYNAISEGVS